jgi:hypothetical protein
MHHSVYDVLTGAMTRENALQVVRGSVVLVGSRLTLEWVLADYEKKRMAGDTEFNEAGGLA